MAEKKGQLYVVDDILACKRVGGKFYYRIRWSGYGAADDTWEGADKRRRQNASSRQTAPSRKSTQGPKTGKSRKKTAATKKSQPTKLKKAKKDNRTKNTRTKGRKGKPRQQSSR